MITRAIAFASAMSLPTRGRARHLAHAACWCGADPRRTDARISHAFEDVMEENRMSVARVRAPEEDESVSSTSG